MLGSAGQVWGWHHPLAPYHGVAGWSPAYLGRKESPHLRQLRTPVLRRPHSPRCCQHRAVTQFAARGSGCGCLTSRLGSSSFSRPRAFSPCPAQNRGAGAHAPLFTEQCLSPSGHKLPAELPGSSLGFLETQRPAWQAQSQPTGLLSQHSSDHCMRFALQSICSCARGWGVFFNLCFFH